MEVTQSKGTSEAHPFLSPDDEFADFEIVDTTNLGGTAQRTTDMIQYEYARSALKMGLEFEEESRRQPVQIRHGGQHRQPRRIARHPGRQLVGQSALPGAQPQSLERCADSILPRPGP